MKRMTLKDIFLSMVRTLIGCSLAVLLLWILPWIFSLVANDHDVQNTVFYSSVIDDFCFSRQSIDGKRKEFYDTRGHVYTTHEHDSILPMIYFRQLISEERFPDSICGKPVSYNSARNGLFNFRSTPRDVNSTRVPLYYLLESNSGRVDLTMPNDVFRFTDSGIEFVNVYDNLVDEDKSRHFTRTLIYKGFEFPAQVVAGNPTSRKEYDLGYLIADAEGKLFNMRMSRGCALVELLPKPQDLEVEHLYVTEFRNERWLGFVFGTDGSMWVIDADEAHEFHRVRIPPVDLSKQRMMIIGTQLDWTVIVTSLMQEQYFAISADDYCLLRSYEAEPLQLSLTERIYNAMPKFKLRSSYDKKVFPHFE